MSYYDLSLFVGRVLDIFKDSREPIIEDRTSLLKANSMLTTISCCFLASIEIAI